MRWPFRSSRSRRVTPVAPVRRRDWARLPPLERLIDPTPPALIAPGLPDVAGTRSPLPIPPRVEAGIGGRATGLVTPVPGVPESTSDIVAPAPVAPAVARRLPMVHDPAVRRVLTRTDDASVGEPQAPATPFHSVTEFDRLVAQYSSLSIGDAVALAGMAAPAPPPPAPPAAAPPVRLPRRPTLAESRRRGLDGSLKSQQEPAPVLPTADSHDLHPRDATRPDPGRTGPPSSGAAPSRRPDLAFGGPTSSSSASPTLPARPARGDESTDPAGPPPLPSGGAQSGQFSADDGAGGPAVPAESPPRPTRSADGASPGPIGVGHSVGDAPADQRGLIQRPAPGVGDALAGRSGLIQRLAPGVGDAPAGRSGLIQRLAPGVGDAPAGRSGLTPRPAPGVGDALAGQPGLIQRPPHSVGDAPAGHPGLIQQPAPSVGDAPAGQHGLVQWSAPSVGDALASQPGLVQWPASTDGDAPAGPSSLIQPPDPGVGDAPDGRSGLIQRPAPSTGPAHAGESGLSQWADPGVGDASAGQSGLIQRLASGVGDAPDSRSGLIQRPAPSTGPAHAGESGLIQPAPSVGDAPDGRSGLIQRPAHSVGPAVTGDAGRGADSVPVRPTSQAGSIPASGLEPALGGEPADRPRSIRRPAHSAGLAFTGEPADQPGLIQRPKGGADSVPTNRSGPIPSSDVESAPAGRGQVAHPAGTFLSAPVYRAPGAVGITPVGSAPDVVATVVPAEVAGMVRASLGIDAGSVAVHRGRSVAQRAGALGARAFTQQGQVFLPDEAGSLDRRDTQALLVHELVHAEQQRAFGADLPTEESAAGRKLEADAVAAEQWFLGDGAPPVIEQPPDPSGPGQHDQVQRADAPPVVEAAPPDLTDVFGRLDGLDSQVAALRDRPPAFDPEDARVLDRLAGRLYRYIRSRLRAELIVDRERSGLLADLSMRGVR